MSADATAVPSKCARVSTDGSASENNQSRRRLEDQASDVPPSMDGGVVGGLLSHSVLEESQHESFVVADGPSTLTSGSFNLGSPVHADGSDNPVSATVGYGLFDRLTVLQIMGDDDDLYMPVDVTVTTAQTHRPDDLAASIPGMYRILDLVSESSSSGLGT
jgi:hypothetical protein